MANSNELDHLYEELKQQLDLDCWNKIEQWEEKVQKMPRSQQEV